MKKFVYGFIAGVALAGAVTAFAQSSPNWAYKYVPSPAEWFNVFHSKVDVLNGTLTNPTISAGSWVNAGLNNPTMTNGSWSTPLLMSPTDQGGTFDNVVRMNVAPQVALAGNAATAASIIAQAAGSGVNGPATAQTDLTLTLMTPNYPTTYGNAGEIDPLTIFFRQSHPGSDGSGLLINGQNTGLGFESATEFTTSIYNTGSNTITQQINVQEASLNLPGADYHGAVYGAVVGSLSSAIRVQNTTGASWNLVLDNIKNGVTNFFINDAGIVSATGYQVGSTVGVSCNANTVTLATLVVTNGIVTHC